MNWREEGLQPFIRGGIRKISSKDLIVRRLRDEKGREIFGNWTTLKPGVTTGVFESCATGGTPFSGTGAAGASDIRRR